MLIIFGNFVVPVSLLVHMPSTSSSLSSALDWPAILFCCSLHAKVIQTHTHTHNIHSTLLHIYYSHGCVSKSRRARADDLYERAYVEKFAYACIYGVCGNVSGRAGKLANEPACQVKTYNMLVGRWRAFGATTAATAAVYQTIGSSDLLHVDRERAVAACQTHARASFVGASRKWVTAVMVHIIWVRVLYILGNGALCAERRHARTRNAIQLGNEYEVNRAPFIAQIEKITTRMERRMFAKFRKT